MGRRRKPGEYCITSIRIPAEYSKKIKEIAKKQKTTVSEYITRMIQADIAFNLDGENWDGSENETNFV